MMFDLTRVFFSNDFVFFALQNIFAKILMLEKQEDNLRKVYMVYRSQKSLRTSYSRLQLRKLPDFISDSSS